MDSSSSDEDPFSSGSSEEYIPNDSESSDSNTEKVTLKRRRKLDTSKWKRNARKKKLARGEEHIDSTGKLKRPRTTGNDCLCKMKCFEKFNLEDRTRVLEKFNEIGDKHLQDTYLCGLITTSTIKRRRPKASTSSHRSRNVSHKYMVSFKFFFLYQNV